MTCDEVMAQLKALGNDQVRAHNTKRGAGDNYFGVKTADIRALAKQIKANPALAAELWDTGNVDAMLLATLLMKPKQLSVDDLERMLGDVAYTEGDLSYSQVADWLVTNVIKLHPQKEAQRQRWMDSEHPVTARMGWSLTTEKVVKDPEGLDLPGLLDRIEAEMGTAPSVVKWTMNYCLAEIGIKNPELRDRAIAIGEKLGAFRDYPVSKGCVSPYAPIWIAEMVKRAG